MWALDGPRFMRLAWRIAAYDGVMTARITALRTGDKPQPVATPHREAGNRRNVPAGRLTVGTVAPGTYVTNAAGVFDLATRTPEGSLFERVQIPKPTPDIAARRGHQPRT